MIPQNLFVDPPPDTEDLREQLAPGAVLMRGFARECDVELLHAVESVIAQAPPRHWQTPGGGTMSVKTTRCGFKPWPAMPHRLMDFALHAAKEAGYPQFVPDSCLINHYAPGAKLGLHQDKYETDLRAPIVSLSLGLPAVFLFGGFERSDPSQRYRLVHGDVVVWGGPSRLRFHGVLPVADGTHALVGRRRLNVTFRKAG
nr:alpha-ketoglutarate-dependent dioxygenase AlkB [uncultured Rhodoferax sp.]